MLKLGSQLPPLRGGAVVPSPCGSCLPSQPAHTQCPPFSCSLIFADFVLSIELQFRADKRRVYRRVGQQRNNTAQMTSRTAGASSWDGARCFRSSSQPRQGGWLLLQISPLQWGAMSALSTCCFDQCLGQEIGFSGWWE